MIYFTEIFLVILVTELSMPFKILGDPRVIENAIDAMNC